MRMGSTLPFGRGLGSRQDGAGAPRSTTGFWAAPTLGSVSSIPGARRPRVRGASLDVRLVRRIFRCRGSPEGISYDAPSGRAWTVGTALARCALHRAVMPPRGRAPAGGLPLAQSTRSFVATRQTASDVSRCLSRLGEFLELGLELRHKVGIVLHEIGDALFHIFAALALLLAVAVANDETHELAAGLLFGGLSFR